MNVFLLQPRLLLAVLLLVCTSSFAAAAAATNSSSSSSSNNLDCSFQSDVDVLNDGSLTLRRVSNPADATVTVQLVYQGVGWLAVSLSNSSLMIPNTAVIGLPDADTVLKYDMTSRNVAGVVALSDARQTLTNATIVQTNGVTTLTFTKPLVESGEVTVTADDATQQYLWAYGSSNTLAMHAMRGAGTATFASCRTAGQAAAAPVAPTAPTAPAPTPTAAGAGAAANATDGGGGGNSVTDLGNGRLTRTLFMENNDIVLTLTTDATTKALTVAMVYAGLGYVSFAISKDLFMPNSLAIIALPDDGSNKPAKWDMGAARTLGGVTLAPSDRQTLTDASYFQNATHTGMNFTKLFAEGSEPEIFLAGGTPTFFLWAVGGSNALAYHTKRGAFSVDLASTDGAVGGTGGGNERQLWIAHGILMAVAWAILVPLAVAAGILRAFLPFPPGVWYQIHRNLNGVAVMSTIAGFAIAVHIFNSKPGAVHFQTLTHHKIGLVVFLFAFVQAATGLFRPGLPHHPDPVLEPEVEDGNHHGAATATNGHDATNGKTNGNHVDGAVEHDEKAVATAAAPPAVVAADDDHAPLAKSPQRVFFEYQHRLMGTIAMILGWYNCDSGINLYNTRYGGGNDGTQTGILWGVIAFITFTTAILAVYHRTRPKQP